MSREQTLTDLKIPGRHANNSFSDSRHVRIPSEGVTDLESHERASGPRRPLRAPPPPLIKPRRSRGVDTGLKISPAGLGAVSNWCTD